MSLPCKQGWKKIDESQWVEKYSESNHLKPPPLKNADLGKRTNWKSSTRHWRLQRPSAPCFFWFFMQKPLKRNEEVNPETSSLTPVSPKTQNQWCDHTLNKLVAYDTEIPRIFHRNPGLKPFRSQPDPAQRHSNYAPTLWGISVGMSWPWSQWDLQKKFNPSLQVTTW